MSNTISPFAPVEFPILYSFSGVTMYTACSGLRYKNRDDVWTVVFDVPVVTAGVYTKSSMPSAPVDFCRKALSLGKKAKILCVNSGNSNAFTGRSGDKTTQMVADMLSNHYKCDPYEVYQASTGVIGQKLCGDTIAKTAINAQHHANWHDAAKAIMTTDTFPKGAACQVTVSDGSKISFSGIAKGSGMIAPHMGTMLAFIFTDAHILQSDLQRILCDISDKTFNSITVDGDTSTSDSLQVFATAAAQKTPLTGTDLDIFADGLNEICKDLALQIVMDGEGISKFIKITVADAKNNESARKIGLSIANSPLVKTAIAGQDANWGRIIMAIGKSGEPADRDKTSVSMGGVTIAKDGEAVDAYDETPVATHMKGQYIDIHVSVGVGTGTADVYTTDLTHRYIDINADYRS